MARICEAFVGAAPLVPLPRADDFPASAWRRASELGRPLFGEAGPARLRVGGVAENALAALAALARAPLLARRLFERDGVDAEDGIVVWLHLRGMWRRCLLDDLLPLTAGGGLATVEAEGGELWPALLLSACAAALGGYAVLRSAAAMDLLGLLLGLAPHLSPLAEADAVWAALCEGYCRGRPLFCLSAAGRLCEVAEAGAAEGQRVVRVRSAGDADAGEWIALTDFLNRFGALTFFAPAPGRYLAGVDVVRWRAGRAAVLFHVDAACELSLGLCVDAETPAAYRRLLLSRAEDGEYVAARMSAEAALLLEVRLRPGAHCLLIEHCGPAAPLTVCATCTAPLRMWLRCPSPTDAAAGERRAWAAFCAQLPARLPRHSRMQAGAAEVDLRVGHIAEAGVVVCSLTNASAMGVQARLRVTTANNETVLAPPAGLLVLAPAAPVVVVLKLAPMQSAYTLQLGLADVRPSTAVGSPPVDRVCPGLASVSVAPELARLQARLLAMEEEVCGRRRRRLGLPLPS